MKTPTRGEAAVVGESKIEGVTFDPHFSKVEHDGDMHFDTVIKTGFGL